MFVDFLKLLFVFCLFFCPVFYLLFLLAVYLLLLYIYIYYYFFLGGGVFCLLLGVLRRGVLFTSYNMDRVFVF